MYCEFCCSNAVGNEDDSPLSLIEVSPQIEKDEHGHGKEDVEKVEKQQQQPEPEKQIQQQPDKPVVEVYKKIRIERSKEGIHLKAAPLPREESRNNANNISYTDPVSG